MKRVLSLLMVLILLSCSVLYVSAKEPEQNKLGVYSQWSSTPYNYTSYNCYGYALSTAQNKDPGDYSHYNNDMDYINMSWSQFKEAVVADLSSLGYTSIQIVSSSYYLQPGERLICGVSGWWASNNSYLPDQELMPDESRFEGKNYHFFVKFTNGGGWFHKFGTQSATMKLKNNYTPSTITITDEYFTSSTNYVSASCTYTSGNRVYIKYQTGYPVSAIENYE